MEGGPAEIEASPVDDPKRSAAVARALWDNFSQLKVDFAGRRVLDFGCKAGDFCRCALTEGRARTVHGVDGEPHWESAGRDRPELENVSLFAGDLLIVPELQNEHYDIITSTGSLFLLRPEQVEPVLAWFFDHLVPGGQLLVTTRTIFSYQNGDLHRDLHTPIPHLLFSAAILDDYLASRGSAATARALLPYCAATWLMLFHDAGFDIRHVLRHESDIPDEILERFMDKLSWYDRRELRTSAITVLLQRASEAPQISDLAQPAEAE
ncbi:MAG: class I SAM-dependent methyltransferase [Alphaproteobacteria bacterium]|nr:class I SAM-dependent methyltransferase [Alphaproteobacteria bacterium]